MTLYHGSTVEVATPAIITTDVGRDFGPACESVNDHTLIRATLATAVIGILAAHWHVSEDEAMRRFYTSNTAKAFADDDTGLYGMSALNIAGDCLLEVGDKFDDNERDIVP